ncbi:HTH domain-containing protein [Haloarcula pellucida]|uniref:Uncharacterized protein n=1 Tax=Haloarcula pellucida TaxID=1427151 RepID=A0A830GK55_9EURY|nr:HTH domain-containing protein [Halomicroarcula pellucida]MBX0348521.1 hypothetical protein [Halomicroarcula pellucida]GGN92963.1 hypothetical protein GCM10009030_17860 [Halomicroarcula pellucida]
MQGSDLPAGRSVELYVRSLLPEGYHQSQECILEHVTELVETETFTDRQVHVWGQQVPATAESAQTTVGEYVLDRVTVFREWAAANGCSLSPAFELREVDDMLVDDQFRAIRFPSVLLVEFLGDSLVCVSPHAVDGDVTTVPGRLDALESGDQRQFDPLDATAVEASPDRDDRSRPPREGDEEELLTTE